MSTINFNGPINGLSFGNVSTNILFYLWKLGININLFPIGGQLDFSSFDKFPDDFKNFLKESSDKALEKYSSHDPTLKLWHLSGSQESIGKNNYLLTFHETDKLTDTEINIAKNQKHIFVTNLYSLEIFQKHGIKNVSYVPLGFDNISFQKIEKRLVPKDILSIGIAAKYEHRKHTGKVLKFLAKKFGNHQDVMIQCAVFNSFFDNNQNGQLINQVLEGKKYHNFNFLPFVKTNTEYCQILSAMDIIIDMSGGEGWSLPSFQVACLGKYGVVLNCSGIASWASESGFELVDPCGKVSVVDNVFFHAGAKFNQGSIFDFSDEDLDIALEKMISVYKENPVNQRGIEMGSKFTWQKTVEKILEVIQ